MTIDFTDARQGICDGCKKLRLLGVADGKTACLNCHCRVGEAKDPQPVRRFTFTPNPNIGQARHTVGRNGMERRGKAGAL